MTMTSSPSPASAHSLDSHDASPRSSRKGGPSSARAIPRPRVRSVVAAIISMYNVPLPHGADLGDVVAQYYARLATFTNPLVRVGGQDHIAAQFYALTTLLRRGAIELHSYRVMSEGQGISMDTTQILFLRGLPDFCALRLRVSIELLLEPGGKILSHTDHWSFASMLESLPVLGSLYQIFRGIFGLVTSLCILALRTLLPRAQRSFRKGS